MALLVSHWFGLARLSYPRLNLAQQITRFSSIWFGLVCFNSICLFGPVQFNLVRCSSVRFGSTPLSLVWFGSISFDLVRLNSVRFGLVWSSPIQFSMEQFSLVWSASTRSSFVCLNLARLEPTKISICSYKPWKPDQKTPPKQLINKKSYKKTQISHAKQI